jgi:hypothetical protein
LLMPCAGRRSRFLAQTFFVIRAAAAAAVVRSAAAATHPRHFLTDGFLSVKNDIATSAAGGKRLKYPLGAAAGGEPSTELRLEMKNQVKSHKSQVAGGGSNVLPGEGRVFN